MHQPIVPLIDSALSEMSVDPFRLYPPISLVTAAWVNGWWKDLQSSLCSRDGGLS